MPGLWDDTAVAATVAAEMAVSKLCRTTNENWLSAAALRSICCAGTKLQCGAAS
jgi:hypothetical protein